MISTLIENFIATAQTEDDEMRGDLSALKLIPNFLTQKECEFFVSLVSPDSAATVQQLSNRKRLIVDSEPLAAWFWKRLKSHNAFRTIIDQVGDTWIATGINSRFRLVRYDAGDRFQTHEDGFYWPRWDEKTFATAMVYLNNVKPDASGRVWGVTRFHRIHAVIEPAQGLLITFLVNDLDHCGETCDSSKYLLRTDIFYKLQPPTQKDIAAWTQERLEIFAEFQRLSNMD